MKVDFFFLFTLLGFHISSRVGCNLKPEVSTKKISEIDRYFFGLVKSVSQDIREKCQEW